jgi:hypothetical protein
VKTRVSQTYPPYENLVLEIWLLREQVSIFCLEETVSNLGILFLIPCSRGTSYSLVSLFGVVCFTTSKVLTVPYHKLMLVILPIRPKDYPSVSAIMTGNFPSSPESKVTPLTDLIVVNQVFLVISIHCPCA